MQTLNWQTIGNGLVQTATAGQWVYTVQPNRQGTYRVFAQTGMYAALLLGTVYSLPAGQALAQYHANNLP